MLPFTIKIGSDVTSIDRFEKIIQKHGDKITRILSKQEQEIYFSTKNKARYLAMRFAGKEAIAKALGTGVRGFNLADITIINNELGKPVVLLSNKIIISINKLLNINIKSTTELSVDLSLSDENNIVFAVALIIFPN